MVERATVKTCKGCSQELPLDNFRFHSGRYYQSYCRSCESRISMDRHKKSPEARMASLERYRRYHSKSGRKDSKKRVWRTERDMAKEAVRQETRKLIRSGTLPRRDTCERCGAGAPQVHHKRYDVADDIMWLCRRCHAEEHRLTFADVVDLHLSENPDYGAPPPPRAMKDIEINFLTRIREGLPPIRPAKKSEHHMRQLMRKHGFARRTQAAYGWEITESGIELLERIRQAGKDGGAG